MNQVVSSAATKNANGQALATPRTRRVVAPDVDVYENADEILVVGDLPGATSESVEIRVESDTLTISAKNAAPAEGGPAAIREYEEVDYARSFRIPAGI